MKTYEIDYLGARFGAKSGTYLLAQNHRIGARKNAILGT